MSNTLEIMTEIETKASADRETGAPPAGCPSCGGGHVSEFLTAPDRFHLREDRYRLNRCSSCGLVWLASPPAPRDMWQHYTEDYHRAIMAAGEGSAAERWRDQVKMISTYKSGGELLDIGCSSGGFLSTMMRPGWKLHGIEMEESTAERARAATGAEVFVGDAIAAPFPPASFDVITCFDVLEHVYSPRQFLSKVHEWLKPGGIFYAMMPNIASWEASVFGSYWFGLELPRHISHFSPASLRYLMTELGFEEVCVKTPRVSYLERSTGYVCSAAIEKIGFTPTSQAKAKPQSLPMKVVRKGLRVTVVTPLAQLASLAGAGPCLEGVFKKTNEAEAR